MIQRLIISLIHLITNTFFRRIDVVGEENIPMDGPVISSMRRRAATSTLLPSFATRSGTVSVSRRFSRRQDSGRVATSMLTDGRCIMMVLRLRTTPR